MRVSRMDISKGGSVQVQSIGSGLIHVSPLVSVCGVRVGGDGACVGRRAECGREKGSQTRWSCVRIRERERERGGEESGKTTGEEVYNRAMGTSRRCGGHPH